MSKEDFSEIEELEEVTYAYVWDVLFYKAGEKSDKTDIRPFRIKSITKHCDYKGATSPIITAKMTFSIFDLFTLSEMQKSCVCDCTCTAVKYTKSKEDGKTLQQSSREIIFSNNFVPIFDKGTFKNNFNKDEMKELKVKLDSEGGENASLNTRYTDVNMILVNTTAQNMFKSMFCQVIDSGCTVGTILQWIVSELSISKAIIDEPDNGSEQGEMIIPPMNTVQTLMYLQAMYGIYYNGIQIFYDNDDILYILNKYANDHDCESGKTAVTHMYVNMGNDSGAVGKISRRENSDKEAVYLGTIPMVYDSSEILESEIGGDSMIFSSYGQSLDAVTYNDSKTIAATANPTAMALLRNSNSHKSSGNKSIADYDELNNPFNMFSYFNSLEANAQRYSISLSDCNIDDFKPNMLVQMHFEDVDKNNEHGGLYFLNTVTYTFNRAQQFENDPDSSGEKDENGNITPLTTTMCSCILTISRKNPDTKS